MSDEELKFTFSDEVSQDESQIDLARAALYLAQYLTEPFDLTPWLITLDKIAESVRPNVQAASADLNKIEALNDHLFNVMGFRGNIGSYYTPDNSFLNKVLQTKKGIPISLSVLYLEIGRRLNLPLWGIGMPRHFIVGYGPVAEAIYIDVFDTGQIISEDDCLIISQVDPDNRIPFRNHFLKPVTKQSILFRMLLNLKHIYLGRKDWASAHKALDLMVEVQPGQIKELKDRGLLAYRLNRLQDAVLDLKRYLFLAPSDEDTDWIEQRVEVIEEQILRLN